MLLILSLGSAPTYPQSWLVNFQNANALSRICNGINIQPERIHGRPKLGIVLRKVPHKKLLKTCSYLGWYMETIFLLC
jgi:hypothetical protein